MDATMITACRTGAMTAVGARYLARPESRVLGHVGARGTAFWNVVLLDAEFDLADILVEASRLTQPEPLLRTSLDWAESQSGRLGALRPHVDSGRLTARSLHAELGQVVAGLRPGRERPDERILLWHRGLSILDIAVAQLILERAVAADAGTMLRYH
jgi:alanine dehydrogenase